ncbi:MAG: MaoC/PaaZ C-terminal domain-containing protein [Stellaceae bacterium]
MPYPSAGQYFGDFSIGQSFETLGRTLTEADLVGFCGFIGDYEPMHADQEFAKKSPLGRRILQGCLVTTAAEGLISRTGLFVETAIALLAASWEYKAPVFIGDTIRVGLKVKELRPSSKGGRGVVTFSISIRNQAAAEVTTGTYVMMFESAR